MDFESCINCLNLYDSAQERCPLCGSDEQGKGAQPTFDHTTRSAIQRLGGLYGGILEGPSGEHVLWCARGVCLVNEVVGLAWQTKTTAPLDDVSVGKDRLQLTIKGYKLALGLHDGQELS